MDKTPKAHKHGISLRAVFRFSGLAAALAREQNHFDWKVCNWHKLWKWTRHCGITNSSKTKQLDSTEQSLEKQSCSTPVNTWQPHRSLSLSLLHYFFLPLSYLLPIFLLSVYWPGLSSLTLPFFILTPPWLALPALPLGTLFDSQWTGWHCLCSLTYH